MAVARDDPATQVSALDQIAVYFSTYPVLANVVLRAGLGDSLGLGSGEGSRANLLGAGADEGVRVAAFRCAASITFAANDMSVRLVGDMRVAASHQRAVPSVWVRLCQAAIREIYACHTDRKAGKQARPSEGYAYRLLANTIYREAGCTEVLKEAREHIYRAVRDCVLLPRSPPAPETPGGDSVRALAVTAAWVAIVRAAGVNELVNSKLYVNLCAFLAVGDDLSDPALTYACLLTVDRATSVLLSRGQAHLFKETEGRSGRRSAISAAVGVADLYLRQDALSGASAALLEAAVNLIGSGVRMQRQLQLQFVDRFDGIAFLRKLINRRRPETMDEASARLVVAELKLITALAAGNEDVAQRLVDSGITTEMLGLYVRVESESMRVWLAKAVLALAGAPRSPPMPAVVLDAVARCCADLLNPTHADPLNRKYFREIGLTVLRDALTGVRNEGDARALSEKLRDPRLRCFGVVMTFLPGGQRYQTIYLSAPLLAVHALIDGSDELCREFVKTYRGLDAIEQIFSFPPIVKRNDIWACGAILMSVGRVHDLHSRVLKPELVRQAHLARARVEQELSLRQQQAQQRQQAQQAHQARLAQQKAQAQAQAAARHAGGELPAVPSMPP